MHLSARLQPRAVLMKSITLAMIMGLMALGCSGSPDSTTMTPTGAEAGALTAGSSEAGAGEGGGGVIEGGEQGGAPGGSGGAGATIAGADAAGIEPLAGSEGGEGGGEGGGATPQAGVAGAQAGTAAGLDAGAQAGSFAGAQAGEGGVVAPATSCDPEWMNLTGPALREELYLATSSAYAPIEVGLDLGGNPNRYTSARSYMFTDVERRDGGVYLLYLGRRYELMEGSEPPHDEINCEHSWPRSKLVSEDEQPVIYQHQQSDLHHLYPALSTANSARGSLPYGEVVSNRDLSYQPSLKGLDASNREVFEPRDEVKGDLARTYFYMSIRWKLQLSSHEEEVMRRWHLEDPVDAWELERNARVAALQGNHNPFILCPTLVQNVDRFTGDGVQEELPSP